MWFSSKMMPIFVDILLMKYERYEVRINVKTQKRSNYKCD